MNVNNHKLNNYEYGVQGTYHVFSGTRIKMGPIQNRDEYVRVLVEVIKGRKSSIGLEYVDGANVWLPSSRIVWNQGSVAL